MLYQAPALSDLDYEVLDQINSLADQQSLFLAIPRRWSGTLRRSTVARSVQGSNSIEGFHASVENVAAIIDDEETDTVTETRLAIEGYRDALTYVLRLAPEPQTIDVSLLRSLHYMMLKHEPDKHPGSWRPGAVWVENNEGEVMYEAPDRGVIEPLLDEFVVAINQQHVQPLVGAAMAHLNLALIHPYSDGNGRMARCVQTAALAANGAQHPEYSSIEEYLGSNTPAYYAVLTEVARGAWTPERSARPWLEFCLWAHLRQATRLGRRFAEAEALWDGVEQLLTSKRAPNRSVAALVDVAKGWSITRSIYVKRVSSSLAETISNDVASRDLASLVGQDLLQPLGEKRGRRYVASDSLRAVWAQIREQRRDTTFNNPYTRSQETLPGM